MAELLEAAGKWQSSVLSLVVLPSTVSPPGFIGGPLTHITMLSLELLDFTDVSMKLLCIPPPLPPPHAQHLCLVAAFRNFLPCAITEAQKAHRAGSFLSWNLLPKYIQLSL